MNKGYAEHVERELRRDEPFLYDHQMGSTPILPAVMALDLLIGLLQAYIFTILASVYVGAAIRVGEES